MMDGGISNQQCLAKTEPDTSANKFTFLSTKLFVEQLEHYTFHTNLYSVFFCCYHVLSIVAV